MRIFVYVGACIPVCKVTQNNATREEPQHIYSGGQIYQILLVTCQIPLQSEYANVWSKKLRLFTGVVWLHYLQVATTPTTCLNFKNFQKLIIKRVGYYTKILHHKDETFTFMMSSHVHLSTPKLILKRL